jgi:hypothetical protein
MSEEIGILCKLWNLIRPPRVDASPEKQHAWRWRLVVFYLIGAFAVATMVSADIGVIPGVPPVARVTDVQVAMRSEAKQLDAVTAALTSLTSALNDEVKQRKRDRASVLDQQLFELWTARCAAKNPQLINSYRNRILDLQDRYESVAGIPYGINSCGNL